jgi:hypothetical protein
VFHTRFLVLAAQEPDRVVRHGAAVFCHYIPETREIEREREREREGERERERESICSDRISLRWEYSIINVYFFGFDCPARRNIKHGLSIIL